MEKNMTEARKPEGEEDGWKGGRKETKNFSRIEDCRVFQEFLAQNEVEIICNDPQGQLKILH